MDRILKPLTGTYPPAPAASRKPSQAVARSAQGRRDAGRSNANILLVETNLVETSQEVVEPPSETEPSVASDMASGSPVPSVTSSPGIPAKWPATACRLSSSLLFLF